MGENKVSFYTMCYEGDWRHILLNGGLEAKLERDKYKYDEKVLLLNHLPDFKDAELIVKHASEKLNQGIIDNFLIVANYYDVILDHFKMTKEKMGESFLYSIHEMAAVYFCKTDYLVYYTGDSILAENDFDWVAEGVKAMEQYEIIYSVCPWWSGPDGRTNSPYLLWEETNYFVEFGCFSDRVFLLRPETWRKIDMEAKDPESVKRYPKYAGAYLFERIADSWTRQINKARATVDKLTYKHPCY